jgi:hypothetical protein
MRKSDPQRDHEIARLYETGQFMTEHIARTFGISPRRVQQIAKQRGVLRTQAEANRVATPLKRKKRIRRARTHYFINGG